MLQKIVVPKYLNNPLHICLYWYKLMFFLLLMLITGHVHSLGINLKRNVILIYRQALDREDIQIISSPSLIRTKHFFSCPIILLPVPFQFPALVVTEEPSIILACFQSTPCPAVGGHV